MKVSFIIPLYNCLPLTQAMLTSLRATVPADLAHEIILVDDGSTDGTRDWLTGLGSPCRVVLNEQNLGFAATCNRGAAAATGEFLFFLNNDLELLPGWLAPILDVFSRFPRAGAVGNVQLDFASGAVDHTGIFFNTKGKPAHATHRGVAAVREVVAVTGACLAVPANVWRELGGFDEGYVNGCEDVDFCLRALAAGHTNHVALHSVVRHHISASAGRKLRDEQNTSRLLRRWHTSILPHLVRPGCREWLAAAWEDPRDYADPALARDAFLHLCHLAPASARLRAAAAALLEVEFARWRHLLEGAPARPAREIAWQLYPVRPENAPAL
ncbi:N-acetylglucosaminyl-diphospho-decaprenol L-rhamnosyltransferase [Lacunisphaera limnophila]|uniref:N-acetylglucosaminyl-diphospho-decaprenol L-rhamnosyltransferase n=1 Tax=Lacunisphaera limnophila TaxID=1838286 RepID=A0A1D8AVQ8_9BACT|nr:glycosyltransferase family 2 protein [Lacunisphaera limnophila]AOS44935.1 N-acetylglucosaminyl-diphospho-decaprenol L-rhamnosyltransferase [Lacunisphaera limnophila]